MSIPCRLRVSPSPEHPPPPSPGRSLPGGRGRPIERANTTAYRHYRLDITRNAGSTETQLAQVRFVEAPTGQAFTGYHQRFNEGPIGYRGTPVPTPTPATLPAPRLAADLEAAVESLTATAQTLAALASQLRNG